MKGPFWLSLIFIGFLQLRPAPDAASLALVPLKIGAWLDQFDFLRNVLCFGIFAAASLAGSAYSEQHLLSLPCGSGRLMIRSGRILVILVSLIALLEAIQFALPRRTADWRDFVAGLLALSLAWLVNCALQKSRPIYILQNALQSA